MIGSQRYRGATALAAASRRESPMPRFPGFEQMAFFAGAYWEYSWRETGITNGKVEPESSGTVRIDLSDHIDVDFGPAGALRLFETTYSARTAIPESDTFGGVRICDGELHDYKVREFYLPGKGFAGWSRSGKSTYAGGGYVDIFEMVMEVGLTATNV